MARLVAQYPDVETVLLNGRAAGETNRVIRVEPGVYSMSIERQATEPAEILVTIPGDADPDLIVVRSFSPVDEELNRFSPLYCRYNGFLLGQFISLSFAGFARARYAERRARMLEFLAEVEIAHDIPTQPPAVGGSDHTALIEQLLPKLALRSVELAQFTALGGLFTHYGVLHESDPRTASDTLTAIHELRAKFDLPGFDPKRFELRTDDPDEVLSPSLDYLRRVVERMEVEKDTAFVIMPFKPPYASYFGDFYRPSLEAAGYRAFRAWGGLSTEDYIELLLELIRKSGIVWADISEMNLNVLYEVGAAHAMGKMAVLVVRDQATVEAERDPNRENIPANIGRDAVIRYSPEEPGWPAKAVRMMAALIAAMDLAASRGERLRISSESVARETEAVAGRLENLIFPPEAYQAAEQGRQAMLARQYQEADRHFSDALDFGLTDATNLMGRGTVRFMLERYAESETDLTEAIERATGTAALGELIASAHYFRGMAREEQIKLAEARDDYTKAIELGYEGPDPHVRRAFVSIDLGDLDQVRAGLARVRELQPDSDDLPAIEKALDAATGNAARLQQPMNDTR